ncbi:MAG: DUF190 domain-containing protein [Streptosporangiaceae bacterium]
MNPRPADYETVRIEVVQLSVLVRVGDRLGGRPLYCEIIDRARDAGFGGATAVRGLTGFGAAGKLRSAGLAGSRGSEPVLIEITDDAAKIYAFLPVLDQLIGSGLAVLKPVTVTARRAVAPGITATAAQ